LFDDLQILDDRRVTHIELVRNRTDRLLAEPKFRHALKAMSTIKSIGLLRHRLETPLWNHLAGELDTMSSNATRRSTGTHTVEVDGRWDDASGVSLLTAARRPVKETWSWTDTRAIRCNQAHRTGRQPAPRYDPDKSRSCLAIDPEIRGKP
jgi:hypothetical protein